MGECDMRKWTYISILGTIVGELLIFHGQILTGLGVHIINLLAIILIIIFSKFSLKEKNVLQSLTLLILLRMISLSIPQLSTNIYVQHTIIYGIMLIPIFLIMKNQHVLQKESGVSTSILLCSFPSSRRVYIYVPTVVLTIVIVGMIGQYIGVIPNIRIISPDVIGEFVSIFLIVILSISFLASDTKYWSEYISSNMNICSGPLLLTFITIVIHKIMLII